MRVRRLRQRRRCRRTGHEYGRAAVTVAQRCAERELVAEAEADRHEIEPVGDWGERDRDRRRRTAAGGCAQPVQLLFAKRPAAALRPGRGEAGRYGGDPLAIGRARDVSERALRPDRGGEGTWLAACRPGKTRGRRRNRLRRVTAV